MLQPVVLAKDVLRDHDAWQLHLPIIVCGQPPHIDEADNRRRGHIRGEHETAARQLLPEERHITSVRIRCERFGEGIVVVIPDVDRRELRDRCVEGGAGTDRNDRRPFETGEEVAGTFLGLEPRVHTAHESLIRARGQVPKGKFDLAKIRHGHDDALAVREIGEGSVKDCCESPWRAVGPDAVWRGTERTLPWHGFRRIGIAVDGMPDAARLGRGPGTACLPPRGLKPCGTRRHRQTQDVVQRACLSVRHFTSKFGDLRGQHRHRRHDAHELRKLALIGGFVGECEHESLDHPAARSKWRPNPHPHSDGRLQRFGNGVLENAVELRQRREQRDRRDASHALN